MGGGCDQNRVYKTLKEIIKNIVLSKQDYKTVPSPECPMSSSSRCAPAMVTLDSPANEQTMQNR